MEKNKSLSSNPKPLSTKTKATKATEKHGTGLKWHGDKDMKMLKNMKCLKQ